MKRLLLILALSLASCQPLFTHPTTEVLVSSPPMTSAPACPPMLTKFVSKTNPHLSPEEAIKIAALVERVADAHGIDVILFAAVIRQESHFKNGAKSCNIVRGRRTCDYGIGQINGFWVDEWELDVSRLRNDMEYNLNVSAKILKGVLDSATGDKFAYSLYNSADPKARAAYQERIEKYRKMAQALKA